MVDLRKKFGKKLKELRKKANFSQEGLAEKIGISPRNLSKIETGVTFPSAINIEKIAQTLNCTEADLFDFEHCKNTENLRKEIIDITKNMTDDKVKQLYRLIKIIN